MAKIQVTAQLQDIFGNALAAGSFGGLNVQLCGYGSAIPRVAGSTLIAQTTPLEKAVSAGAVSFFVYANDAIVPAGTYYTVQAVDANGNVIQTSAYQFVSAPPVVATPSFVQQIGNINTNPQTQTISAVFPQPTTAGNTIVVVLFNYNRAGSYAISDTQGNGYSSPFKAETNQGGGGKALVEIAGNIQGGATTVTFAGNQGVQGILAIEIAGLQANAYDIANALIYQDTVSTMPFSVPLTTTQRIDLLIAASFGNPMLTSHISIVPGQSAPGYSYTASDNSAGIALNSGITISAGSVNANFQSSYAPGSLTGLLLALTAGIAPPAIMDLSTLAPYYPDGVSQPSAFSELVVVPYAATVVFPGANLSAVAYQVTLTGDVTGSTFPTSYPGQLVSISVAQDSIGGHAFSFPSKVNGAQPISLAPGANTSQLFVTLGNGQLYPLTSGAGGGGGGGSSVPVGLVTVTPSATPIFNGLGGSVFTLALAQTATSSTTSNLTPGGLYVFNVRQPASGATYGFTWPGSLAASAPPVGQANRQQTTLLAAYLGGSNFLQIGPLLYQ